MKHRYLAIWLTYCMSDALLQHWKINGGTQCTKRFRLWFYTALGTLSLLFGRTLIQHGRICEVTLLCSGVINAWAWNTVETEWASYNQITQGLEPVKKPPRRWKLYVIRDTLWVYLIRITRLLCNTILTRCVKSKCTTVYIGSSDSKYKDIESFSHQYRTFAEWEFGWGGTSVRMQHRCPKGSSVRTETSLWA